ncbi:MAG: glycoside hydrolase family 38 C-terminal domain-containing protein [Rhodospirillales bacterium]
MNRREFAKHLGAAAVASGTATSQAQESARTPTLFYVDGYHGGSRGHMPAGAWRDILNVFRALPDWKISFDIEAASWTDLRRQDPQAYREIQRLLEDNAVTARTEIVNGTFSQPFGWAIGGESNIRQITRGLEIIRAHFPRAVIETYAVQEPCWSSCLPQVLLSLGFTGAVLKDPGTAWGGYTAGFDAEVVEWVGPDGSSIPAVPRYACEDLLNVWETESVTGSAEFSRKCVQHGIPHPTGNCFQDLGWAARPKVKGEHIRFVTWREYLKRIAGKPQQQWRFSQEDILVTLPWGERTLQTLAQQVRAAENRVLMAEKMASMAVLFGGAQFPADRLQRAWDQLLWAQHHDAWITATTRSGRQAWAFQAASQTMETEEISDEIIAASAEAMSRGADRPPAIPLKSQGVRVFNTLAEEREGLVELNWACDIGTRRARVFDSAGREIPCQLVRPRIYNSRQSNRRQGEASPAGVPSYAPGESLNAAAVLFRARVPAMGYSSYRIEPVYDEAPPETVQGATARTEAGGAVVLETDLYRVRIDPKRGGAITSVVLKEDGREYFDHSSERLFNEYRGYFISEKKWCSSAENPASVVITENGPVRVRAAVSGQVGGRRFQTTITLVQGQRSIDFNARFIYDQETWIGDPWDIKPEDRRRERRRSHHDGRWKLQALFPVPFKNQSIYKNAAYDVCKSRNQDTYFQRWDEIKHNIVLNWVDVFDEQQKSGLAVFSDHTTAYTHGPDHPLALVMGWGWEGGFWWGKCPLRGTQQISYAVVPHRGRWDEAHLSAENQRWNEPLLAQIVNGESDAGAASRSLVSVSGSGIEIPTLLIEGRHLLVRLFNAEGSDGSRTVSFGIKPASVQLVELDGRVVRQLPVRSAAGGRYEVTLALPRFGIRTLRCALDSELART